MRKSFGWVWAAMLALALAGCNSGGGNASGTTGATAGATGASGDKPLRVGIVFDSGGRGDKSFNDSAWAGIERAKKEFGIEESYVETKDAKDYETNLTAMAEKGLDLVISVGVNTKVPLERVAPQFPDTKFAIIDAEVALPNVRSIVFSEEQGSFMAGFLAGLMTQSGKIGFVGGQEIPLIRKFQAGYFAGARTARPDIQLLPAKYTGSWDDQDKGKAAANVLFSQGADIVYAAAGRAGLGVIRAAKDNGKFAIGVDSDQDYLEPGTILTSMVKRVDEGVFQTIKDLKDGKFSADVKRYDLAAGGVGLSAMTHTKDKIGEQRMARIEQVREMVASGSIKVPTTLEELQTFQPPALQTSGQ